MKEPCQYATEMSIVSSIGKSKTKYSFESTYITVQSATVAHRTVSINLQDDQVTLLTESGCLLNSRCSDRVSTAILIDSTIDPVEEYSVSALMWEMGKLKVKVLFVVCI